MRNIFNIIKKEFTRFFKDRRMVLTTIILPGLLIYIMYSLMGSGFSSYFSPDEDYTFNVYVFNQTEMTKSLLDQFEEAYANEGYNIKVNFYEVQKENDISFEDAKKEVEEKRSNGTETIDLVIRFAENFDEISHFSENQSDYVPPIVELYYNSSNNNSSSAYEYVSNFLFNIERVNIFNIEPTNLASEKEVTGQFFSLLLPMLLMTFMFSGCMGIAPESIAGEKEKGTIATMLVTPMKRRDLAIGKIVSLSIISLLSGLSSFIGTMLSLPKMMGEDLNLSANVYTIKEYALLLVIILSTVLLFTAILSIISAYAKSVKEAGTLMAPAMIIITLLGISSMFTGSATTSTALYLIPAFNSVQVMTAIFSFNISVTNVLISVFSNLVYTIILIFALTKMFNSEKIMFNK